MVIDGNKMITTDLNKAKEIHTLYGKSNMKSYEFAKRYFCEYSYRSVKNTLDFITYINLGFGVAIKEVF